MVPGVLVPGALSGPELLGDHHLEVRTRGDERPRGFPSRSLGKLVFTLVPGDSGVSLDPWDVSRPAVLFQASEGLTDGLG
jgi:hypothetical protein